MYTQTCDEKISARTTERCTRACELAAVTAVAVCLRRPDSVCQYDTQEQAGF